MRSAALCFVLLFTTAWVWAQQPDQTTTPPKEHAMQDMHAMHQQHMQEMKAQVEKMRATLEAMKTNLSKIKDPALKQQNQLNVDLWEAMVKHLEGMVSMMSGHDDMGMMQGGMHSGMGCCAKMEAGKEGGCCGANKCMQGTPKPSSAPDNPTGPAI
jgi:uncharacterized protein (DUF885 family)